jgi:hypothetical protein
MKKIGKCFDDFLLHFVSICLGLLVKKIEFNVLIIFEFRRFWMIMIIRRDRQHIRLFHVLIDCIMKLIPAYHILGSLRFLETD